MNYVFRIVDVRTMEIIRVGISHMLTDHTLKSTFHSIRGNVCISDCVLDFRSYESTADSAKDKKRFVQKYLPKYNQMQAENWTSLPAVTDEEEMEWTAANSVYDAFHNEENVKLILQHLQNAGMYQEEYCNYKNRQILHKIRNDFCTLINRNQQSERTPEQEITSQDRELLFQKWNRFFSDSNILFRIRPAEFHGMTKLYRCFRPDFCSSGNEIRLNEKKEEFPLYFTVCPERSKWKSRQDFAEWFGDNKQIADEYVLPVVLLDKLPDENGICETDLYLYHKLYCKCQMFVSSQHICIIHHETEKEIKNEK